MPIRIPKRLTDLYPSAVAVDTVPYYKTDGTWGEVALSSLGGTASLPWATPETYEINTTPGTTDMTEAIQSAIDSGNPVLLDGLYAITDSLSTPDDCEINGINNATIIRKTGSGVFDMLVNSDTSNGNSNIRISNVTIDGNKDIDGLVATVTNDRFSGIDFTKVTDSVFINVRVTRTVNGEKQTEGTRAGFALKYCERITIENFVGDYNDRTALLVYYSPYVVIDGCYVHDNLGSGITAAAHPYNIWQNIYAHSNGYSQVSFNGRYGVLNNVYCWDGVATPASSIFSGINIGHDVDTGAPGYDPLFDLSASFLRASNLHSFNNAGWGLTISGSSDVEIDGLYCYGNGTMIAAYETTYCPNVKIFKTYNTNSVNRTNIRNAYVYDGKNIGLSYGDGTGHVLQDARVYENDTNGIHVTTGVGLTLDNVWSFNNGQVPIVGNTEPCGVLADHCDLVFIGGNYYDDQTPKTQDSGVFLVGGTAIMDGVTVPTNKTYAIRESVNPVVTKQFQPYDDQLTDFAALTYAGNGGKYLAVTAGADGLEFKSAYDTFYGGVYLYDNSTAITFLTADKYHALILGGTGSVNGFTFSPGFAKALDTASTFADAGGGYVTVAANGHTLSAGDPITIVGSTNYNASYSVVSVAANSFVIKATYVAEAGAGRVVRRACALKANTGSAGMYVVSFSCSLAAGTKDKNYKVEMRRSKPGTPYTVTDLDNIVAQQITPTTTGGGDSTTNMSASGLVSIADGDYIWGCIKNVTDTTAITTKHYNFHLHRL